MDFMTILNQIRPLQLHMQLLHLSGTAGIGFNLNHYVGATPMHILDGFFERRFLEKLLFFQDEYEAKIIFDYKMLIDVNVFQILLEREHEEISLYFRQYIVNYAHEFERAHYRILQKMDDDMDLKYKTLKILDDQMEIFLEMEQDLIEARREEIYNIELEQLPIYDIATFTFIDENVDWLAENKPQVLMKCFASLEKTMELYPEKLALMKASKILYGKQLLEYSRCKNPVSKRFINNDWDSFNYHSNKNDKFMHD